MNKQVNSIFLTHPNSLRSKVTGGVQLCSQEFHKIIESIPDMQVTDYFVPYTKNILQRIYMKVGLENYSMYDIKKDAAALLEFIRKNNIEVVFINMASLVRYAKIIKDEFGSEVKIVMLSHGNHSGDFLHLITKPISKESRLTLFFKKLRLGLLISTEALHRVKYLDGVAALSETEAQIENWFGAKNSVFVPRRLHQDFLNHDPVPGRIGFVGRLDHPPNLQGMQILLNSIKSKDHSGLKIRLVGAPVEYGNMLKDQFPFIEYLGELSDNDLVQEASTWSFILNPVWWYSTGASTKLAKAISWGIPIITTTAGMRGYLWKEGKLLVADTPDLMADGLIANANDISRVTYWASQTKIIAQSGFSDSELAIILQKSYV